MIYNAIEKNKTLLNKIKDGLYVKELHKYADIGNHWIALM